MNNINHIADELFNKIRSRFDTVTLGDETGKTTDDPEQARFFNFEYVSSDGTHHGELTVSIVDNRSLKVTFGRGMTEEFSPEQETEWEKFLRGLRHFARRNMIAFDIRDTNRSNLTKRDIKQAARSQSSYRAAEAPVTESVQWSGTTRTSIQDFGPARLIVRHSEAVNEEQPGARSRKIDSMFVETDQGERFRVPYNRLNLGRAMAQHVAHGGKIYDEAGQHIAGIAEEMNNLAFFVRNTRHRQFEDTETQGMVETAVERYRLLRNSLNRMSRTRGYHEFAEAFVPENDIDEDYDIEALKERFVKKMFDDRLTAALPYVYRAYQNRQVGEDRYMSEFADWVDQVQEQTVEEAVDMEALSKLMAEPIRAGEQGQDAIAAVSALIDDEELNDLIAQTAETQGVDVDVRKVIDDWMAEQDPEYTSLIPQDDNNMSPVPDQQKLNPGTPTATESLEFIRQLAGLR